MNGNLTPFIGRGTVSLVMDPSAKNYICSWHDEGPGQRLLEQERARTEAEAVAWGRARTPKVEFESDGLNYWAGTGTTPPGYAGQWFEDAN